MKEHVGLLIGAARRRMKRAVEERVRPYGLTPQQFWALINIDEAEGPSLGEIAASGTALVIVEQYVNRALALAHEGHVLKKGGVVFSGKPAEITDDLFAHYLGTAPAPR